MNFKNSIRRQYKESQIFIKLILESNSDQMSN